MTKQEFQKSVSMGLAEDINGRFYQLYDFDKIWEYIEQIQDQQDGNYMIYLSQVSLYKSLYEEEKNKNRQKQL